MDTMTSKHPSVITDIYNEHYIVYISAVFHVIHHGLLNKINWVLVGFFVVEQYCDTCD